MLNYFLRPGPLLQSLNEHMWHNAEKSCTWYHNEGEEAQDFFRHFYVVNPKKMNKPSGEYEDFAGTFTSLFDPSSERFQVSAYIHCLKNYRFVSLGCNGQKHRGPTVFAMILAYAGCDPKKMADFVNQVWGLNGVREESRLNLVRRAYEMGRQEVVKSDELAKLFSREYPDPQSMDAIRNGPILCQLFRRQGEENVTFASLCGAGLSSLKIDRAYRPWLQYEDYLRKR